MRTLLAALLCLTAAVASAEDKEYPVGKDCTAEQTEAPAAKPPYVDYLVHGAAASLAVKQLVTTPGGLLVPLRGFGTCDGYDYGKIETIIETDEGFERISLRCGGTTSAVEGEATLLVRLSDKKAVAASYKMKRAVGAVSNAIHTGPFKKVSSQMECRSDEAPAEFKSKRQVKGIIHKGSFTLDGGAQAGGAG